ncbi:MAG: YtxH domain-containing protein [Acidobacteria bacterium]|jgi:gas vesicle protein|nr:MAG: YtxH domain-containing protein [Acidobacteriota bacterium]
MAQDNTGKFVWFIAGAAIGAAIAILYAPQSGSETRRLIKQKTREGREALAEGGRDLVEKGRDLYEKGRRVAEDAAEMFERGRRLVER